MSQQPPTLVTSRDAVAKIEHWITLLDDEAIVRVTRDSDVVEGVVAVRPTIEAFRNDAGEEGHNALLRLDAVEPRQTPQYVWLSDVRDIERLGTD
ncbi:MULTISPECIES: DUF3247 family protein [Luteimonas]|nr:MULTISPECIES: DUF3247 family protein [Luteimonas]